MRLPEQLSFRSISMMKWNGTMIALSLVSALLVMAPGLASAKEGRADGPAELLRIAASGGGHSGGGHGDHNGGTDWNRGGGHGDHDGRARHRGGDDTIITFDDYAGNHGYGNGCGFYRQKWHETRQPYWLRKYEFCLHG
jgi:hypothetical protein